jgi:hypothetical protein
MNCFQCGKPAFYIVEGSSGNYGLCIECNLQREQASALEHQRTMELLNTSLSLFSLQSGIPMPQLPIRSAPIIPITNMATNNIHVDNSAIGVLNLGYINTVERTVTTLKRTGQTSIANALTQLTQGTLDNSGLSAQQKNDVIEILSEIAQESEKPIERRRLAIVRSLTSSLRRFLAA